MRMLMKVSLPTPEANAAVVDGSLQSKLQSILADLKPEAAYFAEESGVRTGFIFVNIEDSSQIPAMCEPFFLSFNAKIHLHPAMNVEDLKRATPGLEASAKKYGGASRAVSA